YALNGGAKPLLDAAIRATQTFGAGQQTREPTPGTLKADLISVLYSINRSIQKSHPARNNKNSYAERNASALASAEEHVRQFLELRTRKIESKISPQVASSTPKTTQISSTK
ncbi:hypothetical protein, partial [Sphaerotilus sp.]|uniref:hypothetical protein n=1 Tax=Sphaerotilus sp. TaxID=2093942 RepID=UPI00286E89C7